MELIQQRLGESALDVLKRKLQYGGPFAVFLLELPLEAGAMSTFLPKGVDPSGLHFESSLYSDAGFRKNVAGMGDEVEGLSGYEFALLCNVDFGPIRGAAIHLAADYLAQDPNHVAIFVQLDIEPDGSLPWMDARLPYFLYRYANPASRPRTGVYTMALGNPGKAMVEETLDWGWDYPRIIALTTLPGAAPACGTEVDRAYLQKLAGNSDHIIVDAFDNESYLLWSRSTRGTLRDASRTRTGNPFSSSWPADSA